MTTETKTGTFAAIKSTVTTETAEAGWRAAATQATRAGRDLLLVGLKKAMPKQRLLMSQIAKVLNTAVGEAAFGYALGVALELKADAKDVRRARLARELRIHGEAAAMNVVLNPIREFLTTGLDSILAALPEVTELPASLPEGGRLAASTPEREAVTIPRSS